MALKKSKSHRKSGKIQRIIKKKAKAMKKRQKKNLKQNHKRKVNKDPGIPNLYPFKKQLLQKLINSKNTKNTKNLNNFNDTKNQQNDQNSKQNKTEQSAVSLKQRIPKQNKTYSKMLEKVVENSDVILFVLDARDPEGCRDRKLESIIQSKDSIALNTKKRIILVVNKIDLVPAKVTNQWIDHLKKELPTIAFKASTQGQRKNLGVFPVTRNSKNINNAKNLENDAFSRTKLSVGTETLFSLLKLFSNNKTGGKNVQISVGVIGYPNVGKSSIINSLKRRKIASTSPVPGHTKEIQNVVIDKRLKLLDSPGVIFGTSGNYSQLVLRNALREEKLDNPEEIVDQILTKCPKQNICAIYDIADFDNTTQFLCAVANTKGLLKKGGVPNVDQAARSVIRDWNRGKVSYYTFPPELRNGENLNYQNDEIKIISVSNGGKDSILAAEIEKLLSQNREDVVKSEMIEGDELGFRSFVPLKTDKMEDE